jgi:uncharacterized glyoxalase superfamily protein PhnB
MKRKIAQFALVVADYDEAIAYFTNVLNFVLIEDTILSDTKRWVLIAPSFDSDCKILLAKAASGEQKSHIGNQTGGRVFIFLNTDDFYRDYNHLIKNGVEFVREPTIEPYGTVAVFKDLYGNLWDLIGK